MKKYIVTILSLTFILLPLGCSQKQSEVTFEQLFTSPDKYNGKPIVMEGYYFHGFETIVMAEKLQLSGYAEGHLVPKGRMLWVDGGIPKEIYDRLNQQQMMGPTERFGKVRIAGKFEYGGKYGHLGGFDSEIVPETVELLPWSPPK